MLWALFLRISDDKIKERILVGPRIKDWIQNVKFQDQLIQIEKAAWKSLKMSLPAFIGTHKTGNYTDIVAYLTQSYKAMGCNMFLNVLCLICRLDVFLENHGTVSDEHGKRFLKDISTMEMWF